MLDKQLQIQTLNSDYLNNDNYGISENDITKNIEDLNISIENNQLQITWKDCTDSNWKSDIIVKYTNSIPESIRRDSIIETINIKDTHSTIPLIDSNIQVDTLYCYRIFTEFENQDDYYSGFKNIFFVYIYEQKNGFINGTVIPAGSILLDSTHKFVTDTDITNWNNKLDSNTAYTKDEVNGLLALNTYSLATEQLNGLMSALDKLKLNNLSTIATTGNYSDLTNTPVFSTVAETGSYNDLLDKPIIPTIPTLSTVATSGNYIDLINKPILSTVAISGNYSDLNNIPTLSAVATTGDYTDLINKPALSIVATSGNFSDLNNKPNLSTIATTGNYNDLINTPTFANVATSGSYTDLINRPELSPIATTGNYSDLTGIPTLATVATSGSYNDLLDKPLIPTFSTVATTGSYNDLINKPILSTVATSGNFSDLNNIPAAYTSLATVASTGSYNDLSDTPLYSAVAATGSYLDLTNKPIIPAIPAKGTSTFAGSTGITISIPTQTNTNYIVSIQPAGTTIANNPNGNLGDVYVIKSTTSITVYNSGTARTTFDYVIIQ